ncbi:hypothetical protein K493DRAFT_324143 [Basidiobolus meristosporus CBS 931.73]|uniref:MFS general substrate transporter n=1 Tax=Basidiobolus meristosporus CBS 931.73 TaxID=1314790 RepID=A0A1Y1YKL1_9FUNG|nr:hypothetical protein K493DRAFT_324143 [Basidiobolus meristosporus CBS 931.73]|eukprot:ORX98286.1 hypothetical protein K493DRAFT_324143 [Basidiobolus meristosporus CBS 931.73]
MHSSKCLILFVTLLLIVTRETPAKPPIFSVAISALQTVANNVWCVAYFWIIFNLGGVMGTFIPFELNFYSNEGAANNATYIAFLAIMCCGALFGLFSLPPEKVVHDDGSQRLLKLFCDRKMLLLTPISIASNWFYSYQFGNINGAFQMLGAFLLGSFLNCKRFGHRTKAMYGLYGVFAVIVIVWGGGLAMPIQYTRKPVAQNPPDVDFIRNPGAFWPKWVLYSLYGLLDAATQSYAYWIMGTLTNDSIILARYKGMQSAGGAIAWRIDAAKTPYMTEFIICRALLAVCFPLTWLVFTWLVAREVTETSSSDEEKQEM